jgi:ParB-like chromosome segregation protein Spo0J
VTTEITTVPIDKVQIGQRFRRDLGDLTGLQESITNVGLLHPVVVTPDFALVAGHRRLEAMRALGFDEVPVRIAYSLTNARALLTAEQDENTCRKDMTVSERTALTDALLAIEKPKAKERQREGGERGRESRTFGSCPAGQEPNVRLSGGVAEKLAGEAAGWSRSSYQRAKKVIDAAENAGLPGEVRALAQQLVREMDSGDRAPTSALKVLEAAVPSGPDVEARPTTERPATNPRPKRLPQRDATKQVERGIQTITGVCMGLRQIDATTVARNAEEAARWMGDLSAAIRTLTQLRNQLKEKING